MKYLIIGFVLFILSFLMLPYFVNNFHSTTGQVVLFLYLIIQMLVGLLTITKNIYFAGLLFCIYTILYYCVLLYVTT